MTRSEHRGQVWWLAGKARLDKLGGSAVKWNGNYFFERHRRSRHLEPPGNRTRAHRVAVESGRGVGLSFFKMRLAFELNIIIFK